MARAAVNARAASPNSARAYRWYVRPSERAAPKRILSLCVARHEKKKSRADFRFSLIMWRTIVLSFIPLRARCAASLYAAVMLEIDVRERILSADKPPPVRLPNLLTESEIEALLDFAETIAETEGTRGKSVVVDGIVVPPAQKSAAAAAQDEADDEDEGDAGAPSAEPGSDAWVAEQIRLTAALDPTNFAEEEDETPPDLQFPTGWISCSGPAGTHRKVYLHHGGVIGERWLNVRQAFPELIPKLLRNMRQHADARSLCDAHTCLNIRCVEVHQYTAGGGLTDPTHTDVGSTLTMAVQLSEAAPAEHGGRFTTTDPLNGTREHPLERGDGLLFRSDLVHNVTTLTQGCRQSLVIELWDERTDNLKDRYT